MNWYWSFYASIKDNKRNTKIYIIKVFFIKHHKSGLSYSFKILPALVLFEVAMFDLWFIEKIWLEQIIQLIQSERVVSQFGLIQFTCSTHWIDYILAAVNKTG